MIPLTTMLQGTPFLSYAYSYPHKTAYRPLAPALPLQEVWREENKDALFLYVHIPFCEMRCGFCNLFTIANPKEDLSVRYMEALTRQVRQVQEGIGDAHYARMAIGGGTPTFLEVEQLQALFDLLEEVMGARPKEVPLSCEVSPATASQEKLQLLKERGVDRISIGVQSFLEEETKALGRPQQRTVADKALRHIKDLGVPVFNLDLIYGAAGQTDESWRYSLDASLDYRPEEIYLYPLYVRPLTGLGTQGRSWDDHRMHLYLTGRDHLLANGYKQVSMRMFRREDAAVPDAPDYACQRDGMVGLGAGARSYTWGLHYCTEYAVKRRGVKAILLDYIERPDEAFGLADYGFFLDDEDKQRRYIIKSLLSSEGLFDERYKALFGGTPLEHYPALDELLDCGFATQAPGWMHLTQKGLAYSDVIGPWFHSQKVRERCQEYELK